MESHGVEGLIVLLFWLLLCCVCLAIMVRR